MISKLKFSYVALVIFLLSGILSAIILLKKDGPYDPEKNYDFVEYTKGSNKLVMRSGVEIILWGVITSSKGDTNYSKASRLLMHTVSEQNISYKEVVQNSDNFVVAKAFLRDGSDVSKILIEQGALMEDCGVTKGIYGTCAEL